MAHGWLPTRSPPKLAAHQQPPPTAGDEQQQQLQLQQQYDDALYSAPFAGAALAQFDAGGAEDWAAV
jgi:hypothetical protein